MKNIKRIIISVLTMVTVLTIISCAAKTNVAEDPYDYDNSPYAREDKGYYDDKAQEETESGVKNASPEKESTYTRKVVRNAYLSITTKDANALYSKIVDYGNSLGGYEHSYSITNHATYSIVSAVFKVPPEKLSVFIKFIEENGEVFNSSMNSDDITESYYDAKTRLDSKHRSLQQYYNLLKTAKTIEEIVYIQKIIDAITEDIETIEGRLKVWDSQSQMATVNLDIHQENDIKPIKKEIVWDALSLEDMGYLIKRGFLSVANAIYSLLQWLIIILVAYSLVWIALAILIFFGLKLKKKSDLKNASLREARQVELLKKKAENQEKIEKLPKK